MSVFEIVLYSLLGGGFVIWLTLTIIDVKIKKKRKASGHNEEEDN